MSLSSSVVIALGLSAAAAHAAPCPPADLYSQQLSTVVNGKLAFCDGKTCWVLDGAAWTQQPIVPEAAVTVTPTGITACGPGGKDCVTLPTTAFADGAAGVANPDRSLVAVWWGPKVQVFDTATKKLLYTVTGWRSAMGPPNQAQFQGAAFAGKALAVWESASPVSSSGRLYNARTGKRIGDIVKAGVETEPFAVQVDGERWAIPGFAAKLYIVDVATGKAKKTLDLPGTPGTHMLPGKLADGRLVVVLDGVALVDPATGKATPLPAPTCAP